MTLKNLFLSLVVLLLAGCAAIEQRGATVTDGVIGNSSLGFFGFSFEIPDGFELYDPMAQASTEPGALQQMAIRIDELNQTYHPSGTETFYESFLMLSEHTAFLLLTVENASSALLWDDEDLMADKQLIPLYNVQDFRRDRVGDGRVEALLARGRAYEHKGWHYSKPKSNRMEFSYEACKIGGVNRDSYILIGFSLPEHEHILSIQMPEFLRAFRF